MYSNKPTFFKKAFQTYLTERFKFLINFLTTMVLKLHMLFYHSFLFPLIITVLSFRETNTTEYLL